MDHTPMQAAGDDRALRLLERTPVPAGHKQRLFRMVQRCQELATQAGEELQSEFGPEHVALIVGHNQFIRLFRGGPAPGMVDLWLPEDAKTAATSAGFTLGEPAGQVFRLFGWVRLDPMQGDAAALDGAVAAAFARAKAPTPKKP